MRKKHLRAKREIESEAQLIKKNLAWFFQARLTSILIIANIAVYIWSLFWSEAFFESLTFSRESLLTLNFMPMLASWFMHANPAHLIGNILFLLVFGRVVERRFGIIKMLLIYFGAAIISDIVSGLVFSQGGIGASGAIMGLVAAAVIMDPFYLSALGFIASFLPMPIVVLGWIYVFIDILGVIYPVPQDSTGHIAHLAGFFGITLILYLFKRKDKKVRLGFFINILTVLAGILIHYMFPNFKVFEKLK
jgi:membrane associated rhomboid family serine protease